jgi:hypothetical protein
MIMIFVTFVFLMTMVGMTILFVICYVNLRTSILEPLNRRPSITMPIQIIFKFAIAVLSVFKYDSNSVILFALVLIGLIELYLVFVHNPYHDSRAAFFTIVFSALFLWTAVLNLAFKLIIASFGVDGVFCWLVSLPFIVFVIYLLWLTRNFKGKLEIVKSDYSQRDLIDHITNFLLAMDKVQLTGSKNESFDRAFLQHRSMCRNDNCILLNLKTQNLSVRDFSAEVQQICLAAVTELFKDKLAASADSDLLRVFYISFLMERTRKYKEALIEINLFLTSRSSFSYRLIAQRYKRIIEIQTSKKSSNLGENSTEIMSLLGGEVYVSKLSHLISVLIKTKLNFLSELVTERPSLKSLYRMSCSFIETSKELQIYWDTIKKANLVDFRLYQIYSKFLSEIMLQHKKAKQLMQSARQEKGFASMIMDDTLEGVRDLPHNANIAIVSMNSSKHLYFSKVNAPYAALLGYELRDLEHQPLAVIFPKAYKSTIDGITEKSLCFLESKINSLDYFGSEKQVFLKRRTHLIIPAISKVTPVKTVTTKTFGQRFLDFVVTKAKDKNCVDFLVSPEGSVYDFSAEANLYFKNFIRSIHQNRSNMKQIEPNFTTNIKYQTVGVQREIEFRGEDISITCKVTPVQFAHHDVKSNDRSHFKNPSDKYISHYHVQYDIINPEAVECLGKGRKKKN